MSAIKNYVLTNRPVDSGFKDGAGQPPAALNANRRLARSIDEFLGICRGVIADGAVVEKEVEFLNRWVKNNAEVASQFPVSQVALRLHRIYQDGVVTGEEMADLHELLKETVGEKDGVDSGVNASTDLPLDRPMPDVVFPAKGFCFTGKFVSGTRKWCAEQVELKGGRFCDAPNQATDYLVIGLIGSRDWLHTSFGLKIQKAVELKPSSPISIISEEHWAKFLMPTS